MIDCGADWLPRVHRLNPSAIVLTHAHSDHVDGLKQGAPCIVYAPLDVWTAIARWPVRQRQILQPREPTTICGMMFEAVPVQHSLRAPAVGYRITRGKAVIFYVPDVLDIPAREDVLADVRLYVGDGASVRRPIQRRLGEYLVGHASIATQLEWCASAGVPRAIFTHCGTGIVTAGRDAEHAITALGRTVCVDTQVAHDGWQVALV
jgi:phosphoribosyl 1,2-cyclic phosphodiesterase